MTSKIDIRTSEGVLENILIEKDYLDIKVLDVRKKVNQSDYKGADIKGWHLSKPEYKWDL